MKDCSNENRGNEICKGQGTPVQYNLINRLSISIYVTAAVVRCAQVLYTENRQHGSTTCLDKMGSFMVPYLKEKEEPK